MSKADTGQERTERLMKQVHLPGPCETLKARVTAAALNAWNRDEASVPVRVAFGRLAAAAAAAVILIALADSYGNRTISPWQSSTVTATSRESSDLEGPLESLRPILVQHMRRLSGAPPTVNARILRRHIERVREILDEGREHDDAESAKPVGGRSRLIPIQPRFDTIS